METTKVIKIEVIGENCTEHLQLDLENGDKILATKNHRIGDKDAGEYQVEDVIRKSKN